MSGWYLKLQSSILGGSNVGKNTIHSFSRIWNSPKMTCLPNAPKLFGALWFSEWNIDHMKVVLIWWFCLLDLLTESYVGTTQACRWAVQWRANRGEGYNWEKRMRCHAWWCGLTEENCLYFEDDVIFGSWVLIWIWYQIYSKFVHSFYCVCACRI